MKLILNILFINKRWKNIGQTFSNTHIKHHTLNKCRGITGNYNSRVFNKIQNQSGQAGRV